MCTGNHVAPTSMKRLVGGLSLERVDELCYLADRTSAEGGVDASSTVRIRGEWKKIGSCCAYQH